MDYKYIEQLLDRYFQGETSLNEEHILKAFYAQGTDDMPETLKQYAPLFCMLGEQPDALGDDFDDRMFRMIGEEATIGHSGEESKEAKPAKVKARTIRLTERLRPLFEAAAVVAILLTLGNAINQSFKQDDTWVDAEEYAQRGAQVPTGEEAVAYELLPDSAGMAVMADSLRRIN